MKRIYIIGAVWTAIIIGLVSFVATIYFLNNGSKKSISSNEKNNEKNELVYLTNESSIRTNNFAKAENKVTINNKNTSQNKNTGTNNKNNEEIIIEDEDINNIFTDGELNYFENEELNSLENSEESVEIIGKSINPFIKPVKGDVLKPLCVEKLIFSETLQEWNIHTGTDYKAKIGEEVYAVRNGKIIEVDSNYIYGEYVKIKHDDGYESLYANITALDALEEGKEISQGQLIGYVAESYGFEAADETHLHFELKKNENFLSI